MRVLSLDIQWIQACTKEHRLETPVPRNHLSMDNKSLDCVPDAEADMLSAEASSAICVQRFDDSRNSAIHTTYRILLRSSSLREPRYPLLRVVSVCDMYTATWLELSTYKCEYRYLV